MFYFSVNSRSKGIYIVFAMNEAKGTARAEGWCTHKLNVWNDNEIPIKFHQLKLY